jgi:hypothetical protein
VAINPIVGIKGQQGFWNLSREITIVVRHNYQKAVLTLEEKFAGKTNA